MNIIEPTLILDEQKCRRNIQRMADKAARNKVVFRPHFKTHQSHEVGRWFRAIDVDKITVSSLNMALYFMADGWKDITVAFPMNVLEIEKINQLASSIKLNLLVESVEALRLIKDKLKYPIHLFIKIDTGYHRTGVAYNAKSQIDAIIEEIQSNAKLTFDGFLSHPGHSYDAKSTAELHNIHQDTVQKLQLLKQEYAANFPNLVLSIGDTPTCSVVEDFDGVDEIRPGNFVFYDLVMQHLGVCNYDAIAVALACPIVAIHPDRNEVIIYGGGVHFSKDVILHKKWGKYYGQVVPFQDQAWGAPLENVYIKKLSQEHGTVKCSEKFIKQCTLGSLLYVLPIHSCMSANLSKTYLTTSNRTISKL